MGKPAAIARLMRRARTSTAGVEATGGRDEDETPPATGQATPGDDDFDLEGGIASIFENIRAGGGELPAGKPPADNGATYDLLSRLDQLWQAPGDGGHDGDLDGMTA